MAEPPTIPEALERWSNLHFISQGAEARVWFLPQYEQANGAAIIKERFPKTYRHPILDTKLTRSRTKAESKNLQRAHKCGLAVPLVYYTDLTKSCIFMEHIEGCTLKAYLASLTEEPSVTLLQQIAKLLYTMHQNDMVHGDLTTSNIMLRSAGPAADAGSGALCLIDWGLSSVSTLIEDKAVDLYVLERAWLSTHPTLQHAFHQMIEEYAKQDEAQTSALMVRYRLVRARGRKRDMTG